MKVRFLGTGPSQGLPIIGGKTAASLSKDPRDTRCRSSVLIKIAEKRILIDCGPDFRQQMLAANNTRLDAILFTHEHNDHINGLDDIRPIYFLQNEPIHVFCSARVKSVLEKKYDYMFAEERYPGVPEINVHLFEDSTFEAAGVKVLPIPLQHGSTITTAFRIKNFCYIVDSNSISDGARAQMQNLDVLVINALRHRPHHSHFTLSECLAEIEKINPKRAFITAVGPELEPHQELQELLPKHVSVAYDGLEITIS